MTTKDRSYLVIISCVITMIFFLVSKNDTWMSVTLGIALGGNIMPIIEEVIKK